MPVGEGQFANDIDHWAISSEQASTCSVEPTSAEDVSALVSKVPRE